jgi:hypothetical protein
MGGMGMPGAAGMMTNGQSMQNSIGMAQQAQGYDHQAQLIGQQSALSNGLSALNMTSMEANGTEAQFAIKQMVTHANIISDLDSLGTKSALLFAGKTLETYTMIAQTREKTLGLFKSIIDARSQTSWNSMKQMVQGFKF